jgi:TRAP-type transport system small permease protein
MAELTPPNELEASRAPQRYSVLFYIGAIGLMAAMIIEAIAVVGRQIGVPLLGALEIIQAAILLTATASMLSATLTKAHATVHLLVERLPARSQNVLRRLALLISSAFFVCLTVAATWLTIDAWNEFEHSELLHIPYRPLRVITVVMTAAVAIVFAYQALRRAKQGHAQ